MSKTYALKRLLEHGPMTPGEMKACTRWPGRQVEHALNELRRCGLVRMVRRADDQERGYAYEAVL